jgi:hypothetical protein
VSGGSKKYSEGRGHTKVAPTEGRKTSDDGRNITGQWEFSEDDFDLAYTKVG